MTVRSEIERSTDAALRLLADGQYHDAAQMTTHAAELATREGVIFDEC
jgi:hypothetical protein